MDKDALKVLPVRVREVGKEPVKVDFDKLLDEDTTITGYKRGHKYLYDGKKTEVYADTGEITDTERPCKRCGRMSTPEGHDACIGHLPGVIGACCGHGVEVGYVTFEDGTILKGNFVIDREHEE